MKLNFPSAAVLWASLTLLFASAASPLAAQNSTGNLQSILDFMCLQPVNESTAQGSAIVQEPCNGRRAQQWTRVSVSGGIVHFVNRLSGLCLDARGGPANRTPVQQWTCNQISNEDWEAAEGEDPEVDPGSPVFSRVSGTRSFCLDVPGGQSIAGLAVQIYWCNGTDSQLWFTP